MSIDKTKFQNILFFIVIAIGAIALRLFYLNTDVWYDEACSWFTAKQSFPFGIFDNLLHLDLQHTPLYFFVLHFWMKIFGDGEFAMRILSLIFGISAVPLVYTSAKKITTRTNALFATALSAVSPLLVLFSTEIRMYPVVVFLVLLSLNYLIDFEQKENAKSLIKLVVVNLLIPYTLVGGILYNISLFICYAFYLNKNKKYMLVKYLKACAVELVCLIPYFILIGYYAKMRNLFVISHEGYLHFSHVVDIVRNFFGATLIPNIYWPATEPYQITLLFAVLVVIPCVYFVIGLVNDLKSKDSFLRMLCSIFIFSFILSVIFSFFKVNVLTVRYILYLLPPFFILSVIGVSQKYSAKHYKIFLSLFILASVVYTLYSAPTFRVLKTLSFKTVRLESDKLNLGVDDVVIMPFGSDAPYYFRQLTAPRVFNFDFHKEARNPYNKNFYDEKQQLRMAHKQQRAEEVYFAVRSNNIISNNYANYFWENVNATVPSGRYVLLALYGSDANSLISIEDLRQFASSPQVVEMHLLDVLFKKYLCDTRALLDLDFDYIKTYNKDNYTFLLYKKR